jgi:hypothetical protein
MQLAEQLQADSAQSQMMRCSDSFKHTVRLQRPWGWIDRAIAWAKTELTEDWRWQLVSMSSDQRPGEYIFYFDSDRDYVAFCMKFQ